MAFPSLAAVYDLGARRASPLAAYYRRHVRSTLERLAAEGRQFGALVLEPTCLGAGGMVFVDPLFQACLVDVVRASADLFGGQPDVAAYEAALGNLGARDAAEWQGVPVIYDEGGSNLS
jgi:dethiobiotin synthetase/adenosylmethionine--8-amino-7-oxononanoate aminotransferase